MKLQKFMLMFAAVACLFTACKKDDDEKLSGENIVVSDPKTPEDHKQNLQESGVALTKEMTAFTDQRAMQVMSTFASLFGNSSSKKMPLQEKMTSIANLKSNEDGFGKILTAFKSYESEYSLADDWDSIAGSYTYNLTTKEFEKVANASQFVVSFPSTENGTINNAKIVVTEPTWYSGKIAYSEQANGELPTVVPSKINVQLSVNDTVVLAYDYQLNFDSEGNATYFLSKLTLGEFALAFEVKNSPAKSISEELSFKHSSNTLISIGASASGNFTEANIKNNVDSVEHTDTYQVPQYNSETGEYEWITVTDTWYDYEYKIENILYNVNTTLQLENIKFVGNVNVKSLVPEVDALDESTTNFDSKEYCDKSVEIINKYVSASVVYASNNSLIAKLLPSTMKEEFYAGYYVDFTMEFSDGSKVTPESYWKTGWSELKQAQTDMINDVNSKFNFGGTK